MFKIKPFNCLAATNKFNKTNNNCQSCNYKNNWQCCFFKNIKKKLFTKLFFSSFSASSGAYKMISRLRFNFINSTSTDSDQTITPETDKSQREPLADPKNFHRQTSAIDPEPDSLDSVLSNPQSYPITIIPNRPNNFYGLTTQNGKPFTRQASCR